MSRLTVGDPERAGKPLLDDQAALSFDSATSAHGLRARRWCPPGGGLRMQRPIPERHPLDTLLEVATMATRRIHP